MTDTPRQAHYRTDAGTLAAIGDHLSKEQIPDVEVRLSHELAQLAVAAWEWNDTEAPDPEDLDQRIQRHHAGALALIGLAVKEHGKQDDESVLVPLSPDLIGEALIASDELPSERNIRS